MKDLLKGAMYVSVFAVPFILLVVSSTMFFPYITGKNFTFRILVEVAFASWFLLMLVDKAYRPRWSGIMVAILGLVGVMFLANIFGEYPLKSFWSNFERMEGWVTLVHFFMYFVVLGSAFQSEKLWNWFLNTALVAAVIMTLYAFGQMSGLMDISQGANWRVDGLLGNSTYLGVYMLFHMFIAAWLFVNSKSTMLRCIYGGLFFMFGFVLFRTGTRGSVLGMFGGTILAFLYVALMAAKGAQIKKWALLGLVVVVMVAGGLWAARDTTFVRENQMLNRVAGLSLAEGNIRFMVWGMALEGVKEHPILGWGQENFNYVFNKYYDPALYGAEPWYDRTHNIFLDWLIAGGVLGLVAYLSILIVALWYVVVVPFKVRYQSGRAHKTDKMSFGLIFTLTTLFNTLTGFLLSSDGTTPAESHNTRHKEASKPRHKEIGTKGFTVYEQALIFGLLAAYMFHNLFVFDNLASWIFYAVVLALIHSRVSKEWPLFNFEVDNNAWLKIWTPVVTIATILIIYFVNVPGIMVAQDIINAYKATSVEQRMEQFEIAIGRDSFALQEVVEQMAQVGMQSVANPDMPATERAAVISRVGAALDYLKAEKPNDARVHVIAGSFYRSIGELDRALLELNKAEKLAPTKQMIMEDQGLIYLMADKYDLAAERYMKAYELDRRNTNGLVRLAGVHLYGGNEAAFKEIVDLESLEPRTPIWNAVVDDMLFLQLATVKENYELMEYIFRGRIELYPESIEARRNLAAVLYKQGDVSGAISVIEEAIRDIPSFKAEGEELIVGLEGEL